MKKPQTFILIALPILLACYGVYRLYADNSAMQVIVGPLIGLGVFHVINIDWRAKDRMGHLQDNLLVMLLILPPLILIGVGAGELGLDFLRYFALLPTTPRTGVLYATVALMAGTALFYFRLRFRALYGFSEVLAGCSIAAYKAINLSGTTPQNDGEFYVALLTAGIYLVVRGMDNVHQGVTREPLDPIFQYLTARRSQQKRKR